MILRFYALCTVVLHMESIGVKCLYMEFVWNIFIYGIYLYGIYVKFFYVWNIFMYGIYLYGIYMLRAPLQHCCSPYAGEHWMEFCEEGRRCIWVATDCEVALTS